jgi:hypothetical protein
MIAPVPYILDPRQVTVRIGRRLAVNKNLCGSPSMDAPAGEGWPISTKAGGGVSLVAR